MGAESIKLSLINRLMRVNKASTLKRMEQLIIRAEMEARSIESLEAIDQGDVLSIDEFRNENEKWLRKKSSK